MGCAQGAGLPCGPRFVAALYAAPTDAAAAHLCNSRRVEACRYVVRRDKKHLRIVGRDANHSKGGSVSLPPKSQR